MSRENVELAFRYAAAISAREVPEELLAPGFRVENARTAVTDRTYHGAEGLREWIDDFFGLLDDDARYEAQPIEVGDDYVVGEINIVGRPRGSGADAVLSLPHYGVMWVQDGKIASVAGYLTRHEALEAVGLSE